MKSNTTTILVAVGALLVGGVATAAFLKGGDRSPAEANGLVTAADGTLVADDAATGNEIPMGTLQYAQVVKADPVTSSEKLYATVIGTEAVRETTTTSTLQRKALSEARPVTRTSRRYTGWNAIDRIADHAKTSRNGARTSEQR